MKRRWREDRGSATVQWVVLAPLLLTMLLSVLQAGLWFYARNLALTAAQEATQIARGTDGSTEQGRAAANSYLDRTGTGMLTDITVSVIITDTKVTTTVSGNSISLVPGVTIAVTQVSVGSVEKT